MTAGFALINDVLDVLIHAGTVMLYGRKQCGSDISYSEYIQGDAEEKVSIFVGDSIGHFEEKKKEFM
jgi:hypothetical protein